MEPRIIELEVKLSYQEDIIEKLNQVVIGQQNTIDKLSLKVDKLSKMIAAQADSGVKDISQEEPPPHY